jgi:hypothetical protein
LSYLIDLRFAPIPLQIDFLLDAGSAKDVMTAADAFLKAEVEQEVAQVTEGDVRIGRAAQDLEQELLRLVRMEESTAPTARSP